MSSGIITFKNLLITEATKQKKTLAFWGTILAPLFVASVNFLIFFSHPELLTKRGINPWVKLIGNATNIYTILMLPLLITLIAFIVNNVEHRANGWKHMFALPVSRSGVYSSKVAVTAGLLFLSLVIFNSFLILSGKLLASIHPEINFGHLALADEIIKTTIKVFLASFFILMMQFVISINSANFIISIGTGVIGTIGTSMLLSWKHSNWIPYALPMWASQGLYNSDYSIINGVTLYSLGGGLLVFLVGLLIIIRKNIN